GARPAADVLIVPEDSGRRKISLGGQAVERLPRIGLGVAGHGRALAPREVELLRRLRPAHLWADLPLGDARTPAVLGRAAAEARALDAMLEVALLLGDSPREADLEALARELERTRPPVAAWLVLHGGKGTVDAGWLRRARGYLQRYDPKGRIGAGTNLTF